MPDIALAPVAWRVSGADALLPPNCRGSIIEEIRIEACRRPTGPDWFAVRWLGQYLSRSGEWVYEPIPSSRTDAFYRRCRFASVEDAAAAIGKAARAAERRELRHA